MIALPSSVSPAMRRCNPSVAAARVRPPKRMATLLAGLALGLAFSTAALRSEAAGSAVKTAAAPSPASAAQARYQQERAACLSGASHQDRATCLREAGAARADALRGGLGDSTEPYAANQRSRCAQLPDSQRQDCLARMQGQGNVSGSVAGGGLLRELVTVVPAAPPAPAASAP